MAPLHGGGPHGDIDHPLDNDARPRFLRRSPADIRGRSRRSYPREVESAQSSKAGTAQFRISRAVHDPRGYPAHAALCPLKAANQRLVAQPEGRSPERGWWLVDPAPHGSVGLIQAIDGFEPRHGSQRIRGATQPGERVVRRGARRARCPPDAGC